ncbi:MAG: glycosyltransferase, partial [Verrucomicrobiota bacterium]
HRALEAADAAVSRAGASSLAELAAAGLPAVLVPLPTAQDDHQRHNASALAGVGAATLLAQAGLSPDRLMDAVLPLVRDDAKRLAMRRALAGLDRPDAAAAIAEGILHHLRQPFTQAVRRGPRGSGLPVGGRWMPFKEAA